MRLHESDEDFKDLILLTSEKFGLDPSIIEKDYWITHALYHLSKSEHKDRVVFKGGTSLTKCYTDLHRFSEDIDIALLANDMTPAQIKKILSQVEKHMSVELQPVNFMGERKTGYYRFTQFSYQSKFVGNLRELYPNIRFEFISFMNPHPFEKKMLGSLVEQYLIEKEMQDIIHEFGLNKFELNVLTIERTVIEKLVSLIRMSYEPGIRELLSKTRHMYDLYVTYPLVESFFENGEALMSMVEIVKMAENDSRFKEMYPLEAKWKDAPLFSIINDSRVETAYRDNFGAEFVYGELPEFQSVKIVLLKIMNTLVSYNL